MKRARADWIKRQAWLTDTAATLVFIDETGANTKMTRTRGRGLKGKRITGSAPFKSWDSQTLIAGMSCKGIVAPLVIPGAMDRAAFNAYVTQVLIPELEPGTVIIMDNLPAHKSPEAQAALRQAGCWMLFLPPYSPDLNPIEMAFSKLKANLRRIGARTFSALIEAIGEICDMFSPMECSNYFTEAGYLPLHL